MSRDPFFQNAEAERRAGKPRWQPKVACVECNTLTGVYSQVAGQPHCPRCAPIARKSLAMYGHLPSTRREP